MKRILLIIILFSNYSFGSNLVKPDLSKADTVRFNSGDSLYIKNQSSSSSARTLVVLKETKSNFLKDILPLIALILGIVINKTLDWFKDRKQVTKTGERWVAELRGLEEPIQQQVAILDSILKDDTEDVYKQPELTVITNLSGEIFKTLDKSELLKYIQLKHRTLVYNSVVKISNQTHGIISIISNLDAALREKLKDYQNGISKYTVSINDSLPLLTQAFANYGVALERELPGTDLSKNPRYGPILKLFDTYILPHMHDGQFDAFELGENFFAPLIEIFTSMRQDDNIKQMSLASAKCLSGIKGLRMEKRYWRENITTIRDRYAGHISAIEIIADSIENRKPKSK